MSKGREFVDEQTGLLTDAGWRAIPKKANAASVDLRGLKALNEGFNTVSIDTWLEVIPQIIVSQIDPSVPRACARNVPSSVYPQARATRALRVFRESHLISTREALQRSKQARVIARTASCM